MKKTTSPIMDCALDTRTRSRLLAVTGSLCVGLVLTACQPTAKPERSSTAASAPAEVHAASEQPAITPVGGSKSASRSPASSAASAKNGKPSAQAGKLLDPGIQARGQRYDIAVKDQDVHEFFFGLMQTMGKNIVVHPDVSGKISLYLQQVTLEEALAAIRDMYGFDYEQNAYGYQILPAILTTRVYAIDYLSAQRKGFSRTRVSSGELKAAESDNGGAASGGGNAGGNGGSGDGGDQTQSSTLIETTNDSNFWKELQDMVGMMVDTSQNNGAMVSVNPQAGLVVVRGMPHELRNVQNFLDRAQLSLNREVVMEAKILEVTLRDRFQAGIDWSAVGKINGGAHNLGLGVSGAALKNPDDTSTSAMGGVFGMAVDTHDFSGVIELLQTQGDVSVLSSPRVATVNNQKAAIKVGQDEFFITKVKNSTNTSANGAQSSSPEVTLTPFFSGIVLDVTPQISKNEDVVLHVHPSVTEITEKEKRFSLGSDNNGNPMINTIPTALSSMRESDSVVRAKNNQIVIIGGLMSNVSKNVEAGVPLLSKLPGVGWLFKQVRQETVKTELVILLRPVVSEGAMPLPRGWASDNMKDTDAGFTDGPWL